MKEIISAKVIRYILAGYKISENWNVDNVGRMVRHGKEQIMKTIVVGRPDNGLGVIRFAEQELETRPNLRSVLDQLPRPHLPLPGIDSSGAGIDPSVADHSETHSRTPEYGDSHSQTFSDMVVPLDLSNIVITDLPSLPDLLDEIERRLADFDNPGIITPVNP
jgi:hypothetical protein